MAPKCYVFLIFILFFFSPLVLGCHFSFLLYQQQFYSSNFPLLSWYISNLLWSWKQTTEFICSVYFVKNGFQMNAQRILFLVMFIAWTLQHFFWLWETCFAWSCSLLFSEKLHLVYKWFPDKWLLERSFLCKCYLCGKLNH